jgi:hypothetical protein
VHAPILHCLQELLLQGQRCELSERLAMAGYEVERLRDERSELQYQIRSLHDSLASRVQATGGQAAAAAAAAGASPASGARAAAAAAAAAAATSAAQAAAAAELQDARAHIAELQAENEELRWVAVAQGCSSAACAAHGHPALARCSSFQS